MSKYEILAHSLPRWRKLKALLDVSSSPFLLLLTARLTRSSLLGLEFSLQIYMELTGPNIAGCVWPLLIHHYTDVNLITFLMKSCITSIAVPQGSILGPLLFLLSFNDIGDAIEKCKIVKYADGVVLYADLEKSGISGS